MNEVVAYDGKEWSRGLKASQLIKSSERRYLSINAGLEDSDGLLWIAIPGGVLRFDPRNNEVKTSFEEASVAHVRCIVEDQTGKIWFGSSDGSVSVYEKSQKSLRNYNLSERVSFAQNQKSDLSLSRVVVNAILQDEAGQIPLATSRGLVTVDKTETAWHLFTHENSPLPPGGITAIMQDHNGRIWIGTGEGILVLGR